MELPRGFETPSQVLLLQISVYGLHQSPFNLNEYLRQVLESKEVEKSEHDVFLLINGKVMALFWVDDCIFYVPSKTSIDNVMSSLKYKFLL